MSNWELISIVELQKEIEKGIRKMSLKQLKIWEQIAIKPEKWIETEYGFEGGGFWIVAIDGNEVIWYNDIEEGFNISSFSNYGKIDEYCSEQDELQWTLNKLKRHHNTV